MASRSPLISRRSMLAVSGTTLAAGALAACGTTEEDEDVSPEREAELLNDVLAQQLAVIDAAVQAIKAAPVELKAALNSLRVARQKSAEDLKKTIADQNGTATDNAAESASQAESAVEGLARQLEQSIGATLEAIGELTPQTRLPVHQAIAEDAATLAAIRDTLGEEVAPDAFVLGPPSEREPA